MGNMGRGCGENERVFVFGRLSRRVRRTWRCHVTVCDADVVGRTQHSRCRTTLAGACGRSRDGWGRADGRWQGLAGSRGGEGGLVGSGRVGEGTCRMDTNIRNYAEQFVRL